MVNQYLKYDILAVLGILLILSAHIMTRIMINKEVQVTKADYENVVKVIEANPLAKYIFLSQRVSVIFSFVLIPAFIWALYWACRRTGNKLLISFAAQLVFMIGLLNANNDLGELLGSFLR